MRRALILALLLLGQGAAAQTLRAPAEALPGIPRQSCGYGDALGLIRGVEREAGRRVPDVTEGRARGERAVSGLGSAAAAFRGCGCARLAQLASEAAVVAGPAPSEASVARLTEVFAQVKFRVQLVREFGEERGCR